MFFLLRFEDDDKRNPGKWRLERFRCVGTTHLHQVTGFGLKYVTNKHLGLCQPLPLASTKETENHNLLKIFFVQFYMSTSSFREGVPRGHVKPEVNLLLGPVGTVRAVEGDRVH
jgi:hypothetical protein